MRRPARLILSFAICLAAFPLGQSIAHAAPSETTPPDKIDPDPIQPQAPHVGAQPADAAAAALSVSPAVYVVRVAGEWEADGKRGFSRVVGVIDGDRQRFFVQWLVEPGYGVVETKELEDDEAAKLTFGDVRAESEADGVTVFMDTIPDKDGLRDIWVLVIGGPGDARFGPATN